MDCLKKNISLETLVEDLKQCIPKLSADAKYAFDPSFYILFWALELPDLAEDTEQRYVVSCECMSCMAYVHAFM